MEMSVTKIVYNACYGGFGLSHKAIRRYAELAGYTVQEVVYEGMQDRTYLDIIDKNGEQMWDSDIKRDDPFLVQVVEELGKEASHDGADLRIEDLPSGTKYRIEEYDGYETIETIDDIRWSIA
jgi:hypothetical protein